MKNNVKTKYEVICAENDYEFNQILEDIKGIYELQSFQVVDGKLWGVIVTE